MQLIRSTCDSQTRFHNPLNFYFFPFSSYLSFFLSFFRSFVRSFFLSFFLFESSFVNFRFFVNPVLCLIENRSKLCFCCCFYCFKFWWSQYSATSSINEFVSLRRVPTCSEELPLIFIRHGPNGSNILAMRKSQIIGSQMC